MIFIITGLCVCVAKLNFRAYSGGVDRAVAPDQVIDYLSCIGDGEGHAVRHCRAESMVSFSKE